MARELHGIAACAIPAPGGGACVTETSMTHRECSSLAGRAHSSARRASAMDLQRGIGASGKEATTESRLGGLLRAPQHEVAAAAFSPLHSHSQAITSATEILTARESSRPRRSSPASPLHSLPALASRLR